MTQKIALVTGASRGFGAAVAEELAAKGIHVIAVARTVGGLEELDDRIKAKGGSATLVPLDLTDEEGLKRLCISINDRWGRLDIFVHAAIFAGPLSPAGHVPLSDWDKALALNVRATQRLIAMTESLLRMSDRAVAILPRDDRAGQPFFAGYGATKTAQMAIWDSWAAEVPENGTRIVGCAPKPMPTALRARFFPGEDRSQLTPPRDEAARLMTEFNL